ncbi:MAG TPA: CocE/NonD family hydrolase [Gaiellaceae bacterium]|nr:CocE/NonD family hydrolase [Gaiellaceae bacterium]
MAKFFEHADFEFELELALGRTYRRGADVGEVLATAGLIEDGDADSWHTAWLGLAERIESAAADSAARGRRVSARDGYLRAATYYASATSFLDGSSDPSRFQPTWESHRSCWDKAVDLFDPPAERLTIPFEQTTLPGYFFRAHDGRAPTLVLVNGSDGDDAAMWCAYGADAVDRGYHAILVDGPGQQAALFRQEIPFIPDWERVVTPTIDWLLSHDEVDADRIAMLGCSQGGYWAPRAAAFEHRVAACIADPGVFDCFVPWHEHLPPELMKMLDAGDKKGFDAAMEAGFASSPELERTFLFRARPYGLDSPFDVFRAAAAFTLAGVADKIACPTLLCDPEAEQFWPGQAKTLYDALTCPKELASFTAAEGASLHCEPLATGLRSQRVFDWLDATLAGAGSPAGGRMAQAAAG